MGTRQFPQGTDITKHVQADYLTPFQPKRHNTWQVGFKPFSYSKVQFSHIKHSKINEMRALRFKTCYLSRQYMGITIHEAESDVTRTHHFAFYSHVKSLTITHKKLFKFMNAE